MSIVNANVNVNAIGSEMVSLNVPSSVLNMLTNIARDVVMSCAARHGFDADEEMRFLGLDVGLVVELKKGKSMSVKKESSTTSEQGVEKSFRGNFPLPYNGGHDVKCCSGLKENHSLMTQCQNARKGDEKLCKTCDNQASKNENGLPTYGTIEMRNACGIFEYVAPCGKSPVAYSKVMKKLNLSMEQVMEEATKRNMVMDDGHFVEVDSKRGRPSSKATTEKATSDDEKKVSTKGKGRPKKAEKVVELVEPTEDLFATLLATSKEVEKPAKKISKKKTVVAAEEEVKVDEVKIAEIAVVAVEEVKVAEIAVKETKVKKAVAKIEAKKAEPVPVPEPIVEVKEVVVESKEEGEETDDEDDEESDSVTRMEYKGVKYLKSSNTGVIYNMDEDVVGKWNEKTKEIDFHDVEEEEEEYDEE